MNTQVVQTLTKLEKCGNSVSYALLIYLFILLLVNIILLILTTELISVFLKILPV